MSEPYNPQGITANTRPDDFVTPDEDRYVGGSPLEQLELALKEETREENFTYYIPRRPKLRVILDPNIDGEKFQVWQRNARVGKKTGADQQIDALKLAATMIGNCIAGVEIKDANGKWNEATENGKSMTMASPPLRKMLTNGGMITSGTEMVRHLFGNDGHLLACSAELATKAGYGDEDLGEVGTDGDPLDLS